jgi:TonB-dependent receptor
MNHLMDHMMDHRSHVRIRVNRLTWAVSLALASLIATRDAAAQQAPAAAEQSNATATDADIARVIVSTRKSQQSSIERKKNAATAVDSLVAEDVGSLPDRNIGEAISRMAGIAIDRGDYGEGVSVAVRGNGSELTRVELDGMAVQSAGGSDLNGGGDGRGSEFRQLSADLIKSVDIIKGQTADMTEGSLGGGIRIETRNGLDFKKPFVSVRASGTQSSLNEKWTPDLNLILSKKFLDDKLGVLLNTSVQKLNNESHQFQTSGNGRQGYGRFVDIDNSPEKTFTFQPSTLDMSNPASSKPINTYSAGNQVIFTGATPLELLTKSAAAQSKQACYDAFPALSTSSPSLAALSATNRTGAVNQRSGELLTCLNQWNDYTPQLLRSFVKRQIDERKNIDLRFDYEIDRDFTVYTKGSYSKRTVDDNFLTYSLGQFGSNGNQLNGLPAYTDAGGVRTAVPGSGWYTLPGSYSGSGGNAPVQGAVVNFNPATAVVDANHHLTSFTTTNSSVGTDQIRNLMETSTRYLQLGGKLRRGGLLSEFLVGDARSDFRRSNLRTSLSYVYGPETTISVGPNGTWGYDFATPPDLTNPANYTQPVVAATPTPGAPTVTRDRTILWQSPQIRETFERTAKLDLTYALPDAVPFFTRVKGGANLRRNGSDAWAGGGYTVQAAVGTAGTPGYIPAVTVPSTEVRGTIRGCENTPGSVGTSTACQYGLTPGTAPSLSSTYVMTIPDFQNYLSQVLTQKATDTKLFNGASGRPGNVVDNWQQIDVLKLVNLLGLPNYDYNCAKRCMGSDGKMYDQPVTRIREDTKSAYLMADFAFDKIPFTDRALPFGWELDGNVGYRYVKRKIGGTGQMTFRTIMKTADYQPANPDLAAGIVTSSITRNTTLNASNHIFLPSYNLALWVIPDKAVVRYSAAKSVAMPPASRLVAAGTCTYDERRRDQLADDDGENMSCSTVGNPDLRGQSNFNQNLSVEWYPNRDTMFTAATYRQEGRIGANETVGVFDVPVFAGTSEVNPVTGEPLSALLFDYNTYRNGPVSTRKGYEFSMKTALTALPWNLRYTGFDANLTRQKSDIVRPYLDPITGNALPPTGSSRYSFNYALWYDDGKFQARVAVQTVSEIFRCIAPCGDSGTGLNTYPMYNFSNAGGLAWNPGSPNFRDRRSFIDGKLSYRWKPGIEFFVEGRNLGNSTQTDSIGSAPYADGTPNLQNYAYAGRRITVGVNFSNL